MMKSYAIFTNDASAPLNKEINKRTRGNRAHCAMGFGPDDREIPTFYFESIWKISRFNDRAGLRGPITYDTMLDWQHQKPTMRTVESIRVNLTPDEAAESCIFLKHHVGHIGYKPMQLLQVSRFLRSRSLRLTWPTPDNDWTCSEALARALPARLQVGYLCVGEVTYTLIVPDGSRLPSIRNAVLAFNATNPIEVPL